MIVSWGGTVDSSQTYLRLRHRRHRRSGTVECRQLHRCRLHLCFHRRRRTLGGAQQSITSSINPASLQHLPLLAILSLLLLPMPHQPSQGANGYPLRNTTNSKSNCRSSARMATATARTAMATSSAFTPLPMAGSESQSPKAKPMLPGMSLRPRMKTMINRSSSRYGAGPSHSLTDSSLGMRMNPCWTKTLSRDSLFERSDRSVCPSLPCTQPSCCTHCCYASCSQLLRCTSFYLVTQRSADTCFSASYSSHRAVTLFTL